METFKDRIKKSVRWISEPIYFFITILALTFFIIISSLTILIAREEIINIENARYLLSAIIQSLAAILAIVVTITLVAVQLASQAYTTRVLKDFMKNYLFWVLISMYSITIVGSLFFLNYLGSDGYPIYSRSYATMLPILLTALCLLYLVIYIRMIADQLSLKTILSNSLTEVNKKFIDSLKEKEMEIRKLDGIYTLEIPDEEEDRLTPVTEIITNAINRKDVATAIITIKEVGKKYIKLLDKKVIVVWNEHYVSAYFLTHFRRMLNLALASDDSELIKVINKVVKEIVIKSLDTKNEVSALYFTEFIKVIGSKTIEKHKFEMTDEVINTLSDLSSEAAKIKSEEIFKLCFDSLDRIAIEGYRDWPGVDHRVWNALSRMLKTAKKEGFPEATLNDIVRKMNKMGELKRR